MTQMNMHIIYSIDNDQSTNTIMDWLSHFKENTKRINTSNLRKRSIKLNPENKSSKCKSIWYRKTLAAGKAVGITDEIITNYKFNSIINQMQITSEEASTVVIKFLNKQYKSDKILCDYNARQVNKLLVLQTAVDLEIDIPSSILTSEKKEVALFLKETPTGVITKSIDNHLFFDIKVDDKRQPMSNYTEEITTEILEQLPDKFGNSLFQEKLDKAYEIRSFYLDGEFYSMAILSQKNTQTAVDFRRYDKKVPNRNTKYQLPEEVENKLRKLMMKLNLNTGSLDIVKTKDGRFVFLEVNPAGQYGMTSVPGNYHLDKKIAEFLKN